MDFIPVIFMSDNSCTDGKRKGTAFKGSTTTNVFIWYTKNTDWNEPKRQNAIESGLESKTNCF